MSIRIGNAPCSWGVEFAQDERNPTWQTVLQQCSDAGYTGIELGPVGFMPEDPAELGDALAAHKLELIGGVVFRPFHDASQWDDVMDGAMDSVIESSMVDSTDHAQMMPRTATSNRPRTTPWFRP